MESLLVCTYNEKCWSLTTYDNLIQLVWIWWGISIRVKITIKGLHQQWNFKSYTIFAYQIIFDLTDNPMRNFVLNNWCLLSIANLALLKIFWGKLFRIDLITNIRIF